MGRTCILRLFIVGVLAQSYFASQVSAAALATGVCYSPWHHSSVTSDIVQKDFNQIKQYFSSLRTYHARFSGINVIDAAAQAGIQVAVGVMMQDRSQIQAEIDAVCAGAQRHPSNVQAVYVGNENLKNGGFGTYTGSELIGYINQVKGCVSSLKIPVGSVQRINEWLGASDAASLAANCDVIGANVYPFFTPGSDTPITKLDAQWKQLTAKYGDSKLHISETGWPRTGGSYSGNVANKDTTQSYLNDFENWSKTKPTSYFFMMFDSTVAYGGQEYEKYFGLADTNGALQVTIPSTTAGSTNDGSCGNIVSGATSCPSGQYCQPWNPWQYQCRTMKATCGTQLTGVDFYGDDLKTVSVLLPELCCDACAKTSGCVAYTFVNYNSDGKPYCYLKKGSGTRQTNVAAVSAVLSTDSSTCTTQEWSSCGTPSTGAQCCPSNDYCQPWDANFFQCVPKPAKCSTLLPQVDFNGADIKTVYGVGPWECCDQCAATAGCKAYTFVNDNKYGQNKPACYLKSDTGTRQYHATAVSGVLN